MDGKLNFNGKVLSRDYSGGNIPIFYNLDNDGIIENIEYNIRLNGATSVTGGLVYYNYGTIKNIQFNLNECIEKPYYDLFLLIYRNYGTLENFAVKFNQRLLVYRGFALMEQNYGFVRNGYMVGEDIEIISVSGTYSIVACFAYTNAGNGIMENLFMQVNVTSKSLKTFAMANFLNTNNENAVIQNIYSVGKFEQFSSFTSGPNVRNKNSKKIYNNYYFADATFTSELETKGNKLSLWDAQFQNQLINTDGAFIVDELVNEGYYPWINMPDCMPKQEYIELPEVEDADLPDILSTKVLEQGTDTVKVQFSVNNPSSATISKIEIANLDAEILSQEYSNGKSTVIAELKNPIICVSSYDVLSISTQGAFGSEYTRPYNEGERVINVDLYNEIWNINDWKAIKDSPTENYMLMTDLNFINEENAIAISTIHGIINGNGHTISNINLSEDISLIGNLYGTFENMYINNMKQSSITYGGMIALAYGGSEVNNIHMTNVNISKNGSGAVGAIIGTGSGMSLINSSVCNLIIETSNPQNNIYAGGLIGKGDSTEISNCFAINEEITDSRGVTSGTGGIIGYSSGSASITNCYTDGKINSSNMNVGGIAGIIPTASVENCFSNVNISTKNSNVGGILGQLTNWGSSKIYRNLSIGNIYTTSGIDYVYRILGNNLDTVSDNYAYEGQLLNGYKQTEEKGATLLNKEEVLNINLGTAYNYDGRLRRILPKLYNTEGTELLPNQKDIYIEGTGEENLQLEIESIETLKPNTTEAEITVRINNPEQIKITGIEIEDMTINSIIRNVTQNGKTSITVKSSPNRYYDSYKLTRIKYITEKSGQEQIKEVEVEIQVQFFKEIYNYEDWQSIETDIYQNYKLMADIDFAGKTDIKNNILVNRLESDNKIHTLKNIYLEFDSANVGLINDLRTKIKNIGFENVTIINNAISGNYFGIISRNTGNIENLNFSNITIQADALNYVGIIGTKIKGSINNISIKNLKVIGKSYIGGLVGNLSEGSNNDKSNKIQGDEIVIKSTGNYVGGLIGYQTGNNLVSENISVENSSIKGISYVGGNIGYIYGGLLRYVSSSNNFIDGSSYVGGAIGSYTYDAGRTGFEYMIVDSSEIKGTSSNVGGAFGYLMRGTCNFAEVNNTKVYNYTSGATYIGGLVGQAVLTTITNAQINLLTLDSVANYVGGIMGGSPSGSWNSVHTYQDIVTYSNITGNSKVGGVIGSIYWGTIYNIYINANITANNMAGGLIGYLDNKFSTATSDRTVFYRNLILDTNVKGKSDIGGLVGDIQKEILRDTTLHYNNYIDAEVTSENTSTGSLIIGGRPDENPYIKNTYVYKYSKLNDNYVYATNDNIEASQYLGRGDLDNQNTYSNRIGLGTTYWNYASLEEGKYPKLKDNYVYKPELQTGIDLPVDPEISEISMLNESDDNSEIMDNELSNNANNINNEEETLSIKAMPDYKVYPISVDRINVDFSGVVNDYNATSFAYFINGQELETVELSNSTNQTYTFKYNFKDTIEIKLSNGQEEKTITITPDDVRSEASLVGGNNAYLLGTNLYLNGKIQQGEFVNVYEGYALRKDGTVMNIVTGEFVKNTGADSSNNVNSSQTYLEQDKETYLEQTPKPLHTYDYKGNTIEVYGTYSKINGNIKLQIYNVRSGKLSALSNSLDMKIGNSITDNYNNKEYQTILNTSGELVDLKEMLKYPDNFLTRNIKQIEQNTDEEKTEVMVLYNTGKVIVFNYVSGEVVYENNEKANEGLTDYIAGSIENIWNDYEEKRQEYAKSKELEQKLAELPIEKAMEQVNGNANENNICGNDSSLTGANNTNTSSSNLVSLTNSASENSNNDYITVYNAETGKYEVYSENEILNESDETPVSETEKITQNGLEGIYGYNAKEETKPQTNGAIIVIAIIAITIIALVVLRRVIVKNNTKKKR